MSRFFHASALHLGDSISAAGAFQPLSNGRRESGVSTFVKSCTTGWKYVLAEARSLVPTCTDPSTVTSIH